MKRIEEVAAKLNFIMQEGGKKLSDKAVLEFLGSIIGDDETVDYAATLEFIEEI